MTKPTFDAFEPLPGYEDAPVITALQMSRFLYEAMGGASARTIAGLINSDLNPNRSGQLQLPEPEPTVTLVAEPLFPDNIPVDRVVRVQDLENGCVLRYCGDKVTEHGARNHGLVIGKEYTVRDVSGGIFNLVDIGDANWTGAGFSFVSNPNYAHGFRIGETVYQTNYGGYHGVTVVRASYDRVVCSKGGHHNPKHLTRDETKGCGYVETFPVYDGKIKAGDPIWWWGAEGPSLQTDRWERNKSNVKYYPNVYSIAEPDYDLVTASVTNERGFTATEKVKAYRYMQAPYNGNYAAYQAAHPRT